MVSKEELRVTEEQNSMELKEDYDFSRGHII